MAEQRPLVLIDGQIQQLPTGDTTAGAIGGGESELEVPYNKEVDFDDVNDYIYKGYAAVGSAKSAAVWRIERIEFVGVDGDVTVRYANDIDTFTHIWDNRTSFTYT